MKDTKTLLAEIQQHAGMGQVEISKIVGTSQPMISYVVSGRGECSADLYRKIYSLHKKTVGAQEFTR